MQRIHMKFMLMTNNKSLENMICLTEFRHYIRSHRRQIYQAKFRSFTLQLQIQEIILLWILCSRYPWIGNGSATVRPSIRISWLILLLSVWQHHHLKIFPYCQISNLLSSFWRFNSQMRNLDSESKFFSDTFSEF